MTKTSETPFSVRTSTEKSTSRFDRQDLIDSPDVTDNTQEMDTSASQRFSKREDVDAKR